MSKPDVSGDILRAIAQSYRDEIGPARAEQMANRVIARAHGHALRFPVLARLAAAAALGVAVLAVGVVLLIDDDTAAPDPQPSPPVAAAPIAETSEVEASPSPVVSIPTHELQEALDLIDQQRELEAAEVVVRALSALVTLQVTDQEDPMTPPPPAEEEGNTEQTPPSTAAGTGGVPPEQSTLQPGDNPPENEETPSTQPPPSDPNEGQPGTSPATTQPEITIEELGKALKVEVEELLSADPDDLAEAAEEAKNAATPILEYGQEPTIILPPDQ